MSDWTKELQISSWSQAILNRILFDILSFPIAIFFEKNADFLKGIF
jgi:hypothetical protein